MLKLWQIVVNLVYTFICFFATFTSSFGFVATQQTVAKQPLCREKICVHILEQSDTNVFQY